MMMHNNSVKGIYGSFSLARTRSDNSVVRNIVPVYDAVANLDSEYLVGLSRDGFHVGQLLFNGSLNVEQLNPRDMPSELNNLFFKFKIERGKFIAIPVDHEGISLETNNRLYRFQDNRKLMDGDASSYMGARMINKRRPMPLEEATFHLPVRGKLKLGYSTRPPIMTRF